MQLRLLVAIRKSLNRILANITTHITQDTLWKVQYMTQLLNKFSVESLMLTLHKKLQLNPPVGSHNEKCQSGQKPQARKEYSREK